MSHINRGDQIVNVDYKQELTGADFNRQLRGILRAGIYSGGDLSTTTGLDIVISPFICLFKVKNLENSKNDLMCKIETKQNVILTGGEYIDSSKNVLCMKYEWEDVIDNFIDFYVRSPLANPQENEIVIGKINYDGGGLIESFSTEGKTYGFYNEGDDKFILSKTEVKGNLNVSNNLIVSKDISCQKISSSVINGTALNTVQIGATKLTGNLDLNLRKINNGGEINTNNLNVNNTLNADTLNADTLNADTLNADTLNADTLNADTLNADTLNADTLNGGVLTQLLNLVVPVGASHFRTANNLQVVGSVQLDINGNDISSQYSSAATTYGRIYEGTTWKLAIKDGDFLRQKGGNGGVVVGETQTDAIRNITGEVGGIVKGGNINGCFKDIGSIADNSHGGAALRRARFDASLVVPTANENRPVNTAGEYWVRVG